MMSDELTQLLTTQFRVSLLENFSISLNLFFCFPFHFRGYTLYVITTIFLTSTNKCVEVSLSPCWKTLNFVS